ncbi:MAG: hypothetical protein Q8T13_21410 [Acidobacteriota bacterium]|nr:hypothetical protein [Acidobacteriota bacterium]
MNQHLADLIAGERSSAKASREISFADTVFPGGKTTIEWTLPVEETDIALQQYTPAGSMPSVSFYLLGCASYRLTNHAEPRISTFGYDLGWSPGDGAPESNRFEIDALRSNLLEGSITLSPIPGTFKAD